MPLNQNVFPCSVNGDTNVNIVVTENTLNQLGDEINSYLITRTLLLIGDKDITTFLQTNARGALVINEDGSIEDLRNWAQLWIEGTVLS